MIFVSLWSCVSITLRLRVVIVRHCWRFVGMKLTFFAYFWRNYCDTMMMLKNGILRWRNGRFRAKKPMWRNGRRNGLKIRWAVIGACRFESGHRQFIGKNVDR